MAGWHVDLRFQKLNTETFFDEKKRLLYRCLKLDEEAYKDFMPYQFKGIKHCLMNTSMIDEKWCYPILRKLIKPDDEVCVLAFSFLMIPKTVMTGTNNMPKDRESGIVQIRMSFLNMD